MLLMMLMLVMKEEEEEVAATSVSAVRRVNERKRENVHTPTTLLLLV